MRLIKKIGAVWTELDMAMISTMQGQWYTLRVESDGANVTVWRSTEGELETEVLSTTAAAPTTTDAVLMGIVNTTMSNSPFELDNVRVLADDLSTTTTFTVNDADELVSMAVDTGGTTYFEYDAWGRMTRKYMGSSGSPTYEATYEYKYDDKLVAVESNFPDEGNVSYTYGGDGMLRSRATNGVTEKLNWCAGQILNTEDTSGSIVESLVGNIASIEGSSPDVGSYSYFANGADGSIRSMFSEFAVEQSSIWYSPNGVPMQIAEHGPSLLFHGHLWDPVGHYYIAQFRNYAPKHARWMTTEPLGLDAPNMYWYAFNNPVSFWDPNGLAADLVIDVAITMYDVMCGNWFNMPGNIAGIIIPGFSPGIVRLIGPLRKAQKSIGRLPDTPAYVRRGKDGIVVGDTKRGVRLDPAHKDEFHPGKNGKHVPHLHWYDYTKGKKNKGSIPVGKIVRELCK